MDDILDEDLGAPPWAAPATRRLPGTRPLVPGSWFEVTATHAAQMALRDRLLESRREEVLAMLPPARGAAGELLARVREELAALPGYRHARGEVIRPDGVRVAIDAGDPFATLARLVQADVCLLMRDPQVGWRLVGAALLFPASWRLDEKLGHHMARIHAPVAAYDGDLARRVDRMLDRLQPGRGLWRVNALGHARAALHQPRGEGAPRRRETPRYVRSERQVLFKLPQSRAIAFTIHTRVVALAALAGEEARAARAWIAAEEERI